MVESQVEQTGICGIRKCDLHPEIALFPVYQQHSFVYIAALFFQIPHDVFLLEFGV